MKKATTKTVPAPLPEAKLDLGTQEDDSGFAGSQAGSRSTRIFHLY